MVDFHPRDGRSGDLWPRYTVFRTLLPSEVALLTLLKDAVMKLGTTVFYHLDPKFGSREKQLIPSEPSHAYGSQSGCLAGQEALPCWLNDGSQ